MAALATIATGDFGTAGTWALCNSGSDSVAANTALTTSYVTGTVFTPGAVTIDGIMVRIASRTASPTGTISVALDLATVTVAGTEVTINVSDITAGDTATQGGLGWYCFKFAAPVLLVAATNYGVKAKTSSSTQVNLFSTATTNWSRQLRTTTTQAPAAGDDLYIQGEWTTAATSNSFTMTMNETATTIYGQRYISKGGTVVLPSTASTNYNWYGKDIKVFPAATFTPTCATTSTVTFQFNCTASSEFGLAIHSNSTSVATGATKNVKTLMTSDEAAAQTVISGLTSTSGWVVGDELAFPSTTRTVGDCEKKTILTVDSSSQVTLTAGLAAAHSGTSPTQAEVGNLTRNIRFIGASSTNTFYITVYSPTSLDYDYIEFANVGGTGTDKAGINLLPSSAISHNISFRFCAINVGHASNVGGFTLDPLGAVTLEVSDNVIYSFAGSGIRINSGSTGITVNNNLIIRSTTAFGIDCQILTATLTNNKCVGNNSGGLILQPSAGALTGTFSGNTCHSNLQYGINFSSNVRLQDDITISSLTCWRNNTYGIQLACLSSVVLTKCIFDAGVLFGNTTAGLNLFNNGTGYLEFKDYTCNAGATLTQPIGFNISAINFDRLVLNHCSFGATTTHATADVAIASSMNFISLEMYDTTLASTTEVSGQANTPAYGVMYKGIWSFKHDGVAGAVKNWQRFGTIVTDTVIYNTASPSIRVTPSNASNKQQFASKFIPTASGETGTVSVYVRKSVLGDGTAYNGAQPRLMVRKNLLAGITADTVIDTCTAAADGAFELLTGSSVAVSADCVLEFFVDCDGTTGWINIDDFTTTNATDSSDPKYWIYGAPNMGTNAVGGAGGTAGYTYCF